MSYRSFSIFILCLTANVLPFQTPLKATNGEEDAQSTSPSVVSASADATEAAVAETTVGPVAEEAGSAAAGALSDTDEHGEVERIAADYVQLSEADLAEAGAAAEQRAQDSTWDFEAAKEVATTAATTAVNAASWATGCAASTVQTLADPTKRELACAALQDAAADTVQTAESWLKSLPTPAERVARVAPVIHYIAWNTDKKDLTPEAVAKLQKQLEDVSEQDLPLLQEAMQAFVNKHHERLTELGAQGVEAAQDWLQAFPPQEEAAEAGTTDTSITPPETGSEDESSSGGSGSGAGAAAAEAQDTTPWLQQATEWASAAWEGTQQVLGVAAETAQGALENVQAWANRPSAEGQIFENTLRFYMRDRGTLSTSDTPSILSQYRGLQPRDQERVQTTVQAFVSTHKERLEELSGQGDQAATALLALRSLEEGEDTARSKTEVQ